MKIKVIPNSKVFSIEVSQDAVRVRLKGRAEKGRANKELLKEFSRVVGSKAFIVKGARSREKQLAFEGLSDEEALEKIKNGGKW